MASDDPTDVTCPECGEPEHRLSTESCDLEAMSRGARAYVEAVRKVGTEQDVADARAAAMRDKEPNDVSQYCAACEIEIGGPCKECRGTPVVEPEQPLPDSRNRNAEQQEQPTCVSTGEPRDECCDNGTCVCSINLLLNTTTTDALEAAQQAWKREGAANERARIERIIVEFWEGDPNQDALADLLSEIHRGGDDA